MMFIGLGVTIRSLRMKTTIKIGLVLMMISSTSFAKDKIFKGHAILVIKKDKVEAFKKAVAEIIKPTLKEKGNISYEGFQILDKNGKETNRFEFHELWVSEEAMMIDHKENAPHMKAFFEKIRADKKDSYIESFEAGGKMVKVLKAK